jgi:hypothetical protein
VHHIVVIICVLNGFLKKMCRLWVHFRNTSAQVSVQLDMNLSQHLHFERRSEHFECLETCWVDDVAFDIHPTRASDLLDDIKRTVIVVDPKPLVFS